ncbi:hypothetical protein FQN57_002291 [Myotisia sp. PD_48]|nr:hypothetical protein FQN57_002291 [Myotisia sp. PD_48]
MDSEAGMVRPTYRPAKPLPDELCDYYSEAINLLKNVVSAGTLSDGPIFVPPPPLLALAATIIVHPATTTRAKSSLHLQAANSAVALLRFINTLAGPKAAGFDTAFVFPHYDSLRHGWQQRLNDEPTTGGSSNDIGNRIRLDIAKGSSLWSRAEDFWHLLGWAFNCSILHQKRWQRWELFLQLICEILEDDWSDRERQYKLSCAHASPLKSPRKSQSASNKHVSILKESLIMKYVASNFGKPGGTRRMLRAIFADGSTSSLTEFGEIFQNELKELPQERHRRKRKAVDIDHDNYGDYNDGTDYDEDAQGGEGNGLQKPSGLEDDDLPVTGSKPIRRSTRRKKEPVSSRGADLDAPVSANYDNLNYLGSLGSLAIRQRFLRLLSAIACYIPKEFVTINELYLLYVEFIRHLPLPVFQLFVSSSVLGNFHPDSRITLCEMLLYGLQEKGAPVSDEPFLTQNKLEQCFLPYAANSNKVIDNARVSILVETLLRQLIKDDAIDPRPGLLQALKEGILARSDKAQSDSKKGHAKQLTDEFGWVWLIESGDRMSFMVKCLSDKREEELRKGLENGAAEEAMDEGMDEVEGGLVVESVVESGDKPISEPREAMDESMEEAIEDSVDELVQKDTTDELVTGHGICDSRGRNY